jgi:hypothetical protein
MGGLDNNETRDKSPELTNTEAGRRTASGLEKGLYPYNYSPFFAYLRIGNLPFAGALKFKSGESA